MKRSVLVAMVFVCIQAVTVLKRETGLVSGWETSKSWERLCWFLQGESDMWVCAFRLMTNRVHRGQSPHKQ